MAGLTPTQRNALKNRINRDAHARAKAEGAPNSASATRANTGTLSAAPNQDPKGQDSSTQVSIAGVPLRLKSSHDLETVNELVRMVDDKIRQAMPLTKTGSIQNASILAALNMAEELLILKRRARELTDGLETRLAHVIEDLEKSGPTAT